jgi:hypothetical protein
MAVEYRPPIRIVKGVGSGEAVEYWPLERGKAVEYRPPRRGKKGTKPLFHEGRGNSKGVTDKDLAER